MSKARVLGRLGLIVRVIVAALVLGLLVDTWFVQGWLAPIVVDSGSMAPALLGPHIDVTCSRCKFRFPIDAQSPPPRAMALCPNCYETNSVEHLSEQAGVRVLVDRAALAFRDPRRWEIVVFRCPENSRRLCVKRVVGLPGETVAVRFGDVWIDGKIARKPLDVLRKMAIHVHDSRLRDAEGRVSERWSPSGEGGWKRVFTRYLHEPTDDDFDAGAVHWLTYRHVDPIRFGGPILDSEPYNQGESRQLVAVYDVLLRCQLNVSGSGTIAFEATDEKLTFRAQIVVPTGEGTLYRDEERVASFQIDPARLAKPLEIEWAMYDEQVVLAVLGEVVCQFPFQRLLRQPPSSNAPLNIQARGATVTISDLQVFRDVNYGDSPDGGGSYQLAASEYYVLGDNTSVSDDSRTWDKPGLAVCAIVGRPVSIRPERDAR